MYLAIVLLTPPAYNGSPASLQLVGGVRALDHLLQQLRHTHFVKRTILLCNTSAFTRHFQNYAITRHISETDVMCIDTAEGISSIISGLQADDSTEHIVLIDGDYFVVDECALSNALTQADDSNVSHISGGLFRQLYTFQEKSVFFLQNSSQNSKLIEFLTTDLSNIDSSVASTDTDSILDRFIQFGDTTDTNVSPVTRHSLTHTYDLRIPSQRVEADRYLAIHTEKEIALLPHECEVSCYARVGLMGNPSDGFGGKTVSFLIENFRAVVRMTATSSERGIEIVEPLVFSRLDELHLHSTVIGYSTGGRLLQAACKVFSAYCFRNGITVHTKRCFRMTYETDVPRMVGLSGSSAIVVSAFRCLMQFYGLSLDELNIKKEDLPQVILDIERHELGISAGLQDRVIQTYGGLVHMDFTPSSITTSGAATGEQQQASESTERLLSSRYTVMDPALLPHMYLAYDECAGGDSGKVHSTVKERWAKQEPELVAGMQTLGQYADQARVCLLNGDHTGLATLVEQNFAMRRRLYGDAVVGTKNIQMVQLAKKYGLSAKFTGSGGALVCLRSDGLGWLDSTDEKRIIAEYHKHGFNFVRIRIPQCM